MRITLTGLKALIIGLAVLAFVVALFLFILNLFILIIPIIVVLAILGYIFSLFRKKKSKVKETSFIDVEYKVKK